MRATRTLSGTSLRAQVVDDAGVELSVGEEVGNDLVVGCSLDGDLCGRTDDVVAGVAQLVEVFEAHEVAAVAHDVLQVGHSAEHLGQGGDVDPESFLEFLVVAGIHAVGACAGLHLVVDEPSGAVAPEHESVVSCGGGVAVEDVAHGALHDHGVAGAHEPVGAADAEVGEADSVGDLSVADACEPGDVGVHVAAYEDDQVVCGAEVARAFLDFLEVGGGGHS